MGNCMGSCLPTSRRLFSSDDKTDFADLINNPNEDTTNKRCFLIRHFLKTKKKHRPKEAVLNLVEDIFPSSKSTNYSKLNKIPHSSDRQNIPLQCLDARALLTNTANSTPASSLDLEWEHEALPLEVVQEPCNSSWYKYFFFI
ncbi:uncharacterized protein LOC112906110 [Agrilus planipennis]|uniref:Uncharacterized protein LOC112906110 n=1 Tax=Agrilus planipennis TaxID=224129 RepID=A0A7F5RHS6_AGRPL|nr:uncharacterized protein LOC112906110 [Agrilus planipennis]XP_025835552.1 uncharacterized protein LOC112906110 [Agrilus planipennis]